MNPIDALNAILSQYGSHLDSVLFTNLADLSDSLDTANESLAMVLSSAVFDFAGNFGRELTALVEAVRRSGGQVGGSRAANVPTGGRGGKEGGGVGDLIGGLMSTAVGKIALIFAPLIAISTVLGQATSGLQLFTGAVNILGATLAPLLLPVFVLLSAAVIAVADTLWEHIQPALKDFYKWVFDNAIPAVQAFSNALEDAYQGLMDFVDDVKVLMPGVKEQVFGAGPEGDARGEQAKDFAGKLLKFVLAPGLAVLGPAANAGRQELRDKANAERVERGMEPKARIGQPFKEDRGKNPLGFFDKFMQGIDDSIRQLEMTQGSKTQLTGLVQASRAAQTAALSMTPFEQKSLQRQQETIKAIRDGIEEFKRGFRA